MKKLLVVAVLCATVVAIATILKLHGHAEPEPAFQGRTITDLVTGPDYSGNKEQVAEAVLAFRESALPPLRRLLRGGNKLERLILTKAPARFWNRRPLKGWWQQQTEKERALAAVEILGEMGRGAVPDLLKIVRDSSESFEMRQRAMQVLLAVRADPSLVIPVLEKWKNDVIIGGAASRCIKDFQTGKFWPAQPREDNVTHLYRSGGRSPRLPAASAEHEYQPGDRLLSGDLSGTANASLPRFPRIDGISSSTDEKLERSGARPASEPSTLRRDAEAGNIDAQSQLAAYLSQGRGGFAKDPVEVYAWAAVAASRGQTTAKYLVRELELFMSQQDLAAARSLAQVFQARNPEKNH